MLFQPSTFTVSKSSDESYEGKAMWPSVLGSPIPWKVTGVYWVQGRRPIIDGEGFWHVDDVVAGETGNTGTFVLSAQAHDQIELLKVKATFILKVEFKGKPVEKVRVELA